MNKLFPDMLWNYKNFNMVMELDIAGEFIYDAMHAFYQLDVIENNSTLFSFLYHASVGFERLQKIVIVLFENYSLDKHQKFEKQLITHSHIVLNGKIRKKLNFETNPRENDFLLVMTEFYKSMRYRHFNVEPADSDMRMKVADYLRKYLTDDDLNYSVTTGYILVNDKVKELIGRVMGGLAKKYYELVRKECIRVKTFTYELRSGSKAEKVFRGSYRKNSLQEQKITERIAQKELMLYLRRAKDKSAFFRYMDDLEPLEFDSGVVNEYLYDLVKGIVPQELIDEIEFLYEENGYSKERVEQIDLLGDPRVMFDYREIDSCCQLLRELVTGKLTANEFAVAFPKVLDLVEDECTHDLLDDLLELCNKIIGKNMLETEFRSKAESYYLKIKNFYNLQD